MDFLKPFLTWQDKIANIPLSYLMKTYDAFIAILYDGYIINRVYGIIPSPILLYFFQIILSKKAKRDNRIISSASMKLKTIIPLDNQTQQSHPFQWLLNTESTFQMYYGSAAKSLTHCFVRRSSAVERAKMKSLPLKTLNFQGFIDWKQDCNIIEMVPLNLIFLLLFCYAFWGRL